MRKSETVTVDGHVYTINMLGALEGKDLFAKIAKVIDASGNQRIAELFEVPGLIDTMARQTLLHIGQNRPVLSSLFDDHFAGRYEALGEWLGHCIRVNFQSRKTAKADDASNGQ